MYASANDRVRRLRSEERRTVDRTPVAIGEEDGGGLKATTISSVAMLKIYQSDWMAAAAFA